MRKTRSDVVISVGANDGRNAAAAIAHRPSLLDTSLDVDDDNEVMEGQQEAKKSVAFGPDVVTDEDAVASGDPNAQPDCCDMMCPTNYIESMLCKADEALCVCDITDNFEAVTGIQLCADDEDDDEEDIDNDVDDDDNEESAAVKVVDNSLVVVKADSPSNTTCDETVSDAEASVHNASRSNSVLDESSGIDLQKDIGVLEEPNSPAAAAADTLQEMIETDKKDEDVDADATQEGNEEGSILSETLSAFSGMLRNPFPDDVSPIKKAKAKGAAASNTPETIVESPSSDNANGDNSDAKEEDTAATTAKTTTTDEKDKEIKDHATTTSKAPANSEDVVLHKIESGDDTNAKTKEEKVGATVQDDADPNAVVADKNEASPADTTDNTANITTEEEGPEPTNAAADNTDDILDITSDLQKIETDATSRRIQVLLRDAYGEQCFSPDELESKGQVLLERYAGREALLIAALEKKIRERKEAMEVVENAHKAALGELEGAVTTAAGATSATTAAVPAPAPAASVESKKVKTRKSKLGKAKGLVKKFHKFSSPKKSSTAASC